MIVAGPDMPLRGRVNGGTRENAMSIGIFGNRPGPGMTRAGGRALVADRAAAPERRRRRLRVPAAWRMLALILVMLVGGQGQSLAVVKLAYEQAVNQEYDYLVWKYKQSGGPLQIEVADKIVSLLESLTGVSLSPNEREQLRKHILTEYSLFESYRLLAHLTAANAVVHNKGRRRGYVPSTPSAFTTFFTPKDGIKSVPGGDPTVSVPLPEYKEIDLLVNGGPPSVGNRDYKIPPGTDNILFLQQLLTTSK